ncbi:PRK06851 family protein [Haloimpatiens lingqiaonensis]|uniref:PRK06851 family protein n=1 Tax=Haloimpatiens lingqiaonensis TaxID=1380675 RepID=UPI0010FE60A3|nr:PRK06851 family protein [Haloimpatiens lingqiaonensis]
MKGTIRHLFPGGNTSQGFYSYYHYILSQEDANKIICIKGGPGTGKSSMMKKIGEYFNSNGYNIEYHHCSSDNNSLDGVLIPALKVAILDATAPHIVDPKNPGAVDEVLNLSDCWDEKKLRNNKSEIISINNAIGNTFKRAYKYIEAAKIIHDGWSNLNLEAMDFSKLNMLKEKLKEELFKNKVSTLGKERHLFATAFTPNGIVTYIDNLQENYKNIYVLNGEPGTCKSNILSFLGNEAIKRGHYVEIFHKPLIPQEIEHVLIPDLNVALLTSNEINKKEFSGTQIYTNELQKENILNKNLTKIQDEKETFYLLLDKGLEIISGAKTLHDQLEAYYIPAMDFTKVNEKYKKVLNNFLEYESKNTVDNAFKQIKNDIFFV